MAVFGERCCGDIGNVVRIDEGLGHLSRGQGDVTGQDHVQELSFGEVLIEPARAQDGPFQSRVLNDLLAALRLFFATPG